MKAIHVAFAAALLVGGLARHNCLGQALSEKEYLSVVLPQELMPYAGVIDGRPLKRPPRRSCVRPWMAWSPTVALLRSVKRRDMWSIISRLTESQTRLEQKLVVD